MVYLIMGALVFLLAGLGLWGARAWLAAGQVGRDVEALRETVLRQQAELADLRATAGTGVHAVSIEKAAQQKLLVRLEALERENPALKEDILLFERLVPVGGEEGVLRIENFRLVAEGQGRLRYRVLLAFQPSRQIPEFKGRLQLLVTVAHGGRETPLQFPDRRSEAPEYSFEIRHFLRREGVLDLPAGAVIKAAELRVMQGDTLRAKRLAQPWE